MIVQVKTLEGRLFKVEAAPETNIKAVKDLIEASQPELKAAMMKLIHSGKVLKDDETLADKGVTEQSFLVCMVTKPKRARVHGTGEHVYGPYALWRGVDCCGLALARLRNPHAT